MMYNSSNTHTNNVDLMNSLVHRPQLNHQVWLTPLYQTRSKYTEHTRFRIKLGANNEHTVDPIILGRIRHI